MALVVSPHNALCFSKNSSSASFPSFFICLIVCALLTLLYILIVQCNGTKMNSEGFVTVDRKYKLRYFVAGISLAHT